MKKQTNQTKPTRSPNILAACLVLGVFSILLLAAPQPGLSSTSISKPLPTLSPPPNIISANQEASLEDAINIALQTKGAAWQVYRWQIDHLTQPQGSAHALVWLAPTDPDTGIPLGTEPRRVIASLQNDGNWSLVFEDEVSYSQKLVETKLDQSDPVSSMVPETEVSTDRAGTVYGGYYLPWDPGLTKRLTWSISHTSCYLDYCYYAFDFADGTMFPLRAAKMGYVYHFKDSCVNGATDCTNSITIEDRSTTPYTYQVYLHIAQNSVPPKLRTIGAVVWQGRFIGNVDDTGYSTGHHVHFMVVSKDTLYYSKTGEYYFGRSVDITFRDVPINWDEAT